VIEVNARICSTCGTREDARRGSSPVCLTCGQPFLRPSMTGAAPKGSSTLIWVGVGLFCALCLVAILIAGGVFLASQGVFDDKPPPKRATAAPIVVQPPVTSTVASSATTSQPAPLTDEERDELAGNYTCSLDDTPAFRCRIANNTLEKLDGSQRFKGPVRKLGGGNLGFSGTFFCPFGACTHPVSTTFIRQGPGRYVGKFGPNSVPGGGPGGERVVLTKVR
jgi:hypothetical protein